MMVQLITLKVKVGHMAPQFRTLAALPEACSVVPSNPVKWSTGACNSSSRKSNGLFQSLQAHTCIYNIGIQTHTQTCQ